MKALRPLLLLMFLGLITAAHARDRRGYPMNVNAASVQTITFDVQEGDLVLRGDPNAHAIRMMVSVDRFFIFKLGEKDILKRLIKVTGEGTPEITIATEIPRSIANWGRAEYPIDFEVTIPAGARLTVRDTSGVIEIYDVGGDVAIEDGSGTLAVRGLDGSLRITKTSGDIRVENVQGATTLDSRSGQMRLRRLAALDIVASDGNLDIEQAGATRIHNRGGNIRVSSVRGDLEIDDDSGEIVANDVQGKVTIRDTSGQVRTARTGEVTVTDTSGDLTVDSARALKVLAKESGSVTIRHVSGDVSVPPGIDRKEKD